MKLPKFDYIRPDTLAEACKILAEEGTDAQIMAGGTDLLAALKYGLKKPRLLVDISSLSDLQQITYDAQDGLVVGALVTLRHLAAALVVKEHYPLLAQAALSVGSVQLQTMGTLGGNLCQDTCCVYYNLPPMSRLGMDACFKLAGRTCHAVKGSKVCWATYAGDMAPALLALLATVTLAGGKGEKTIPLQDLYSGKGERPHLLKPGQMLKDIRIPPPGRNIGLYLKMRMRQSIDYPLLGVAVNLSAVEGGKSIKELTIGLTAMEKSPLLVTPPREFYETDDAEKQGDIMAKAAHAKARPVANTSGYSPRYRRDMVGVYVKQGISRAMAVAEGRTKTP